MSTAGVQRFRKKPVEVEAIRIFKWVDDEVIRWLSEGGCDFEITPLGGVSIITLEGAMVADAGDWIIKGIAGEFYPCKPDIFEATYESAVPRAAR